MFCPIQGYRKQYQNAVTCFEHECAWWDKVRKQCMITTFIQAQSQNLPTPVETWNQAHPKKSEMTKLAEFLQNEYSFEVGM